MKKNTFFKMITLMLSVCLIFGLSGCGEDKESRKTLTSMLDTLKEGKYTEAVSEYTLQTEGIADFLQCKDKFSKEEFPAYDMHMAVFETLEYDITKVKAIDENKIRYTVDITTTDLAPVGKELANSTAAYNIAAQNAEEDEKLSENDLNNLLTQQMVTISSEYLKGNDVKKRTVTVNVEMFYDVAAGWLVYVDDALADALNGGVYTTFYTEMENADMVTK